MGVCERAEMYFMMLALEHGLKVSKPYGESGGMTWEWRDGGAAGAGEVDDLQAAGDGYSLNVMGPKRKKYVPGTVDFLRCC
jgi:hypothetical protein